MLVDARSGARHGVGKDIIARVWRERGLRPWRVDVFKLSNDKNFEAKLRDVVGLYLDPPEAAVVFSFDEKTQVQALDRTQPSLPLRRGRAATMTHDYKRNGTVDLFAALNVATGEVLHQTRRRHTGADVLAFFRWIDVHTPRDLDVHVILDNLSAHKSEPVRKWLANPERRRWHLHYTPTSASWLNLVEGWFSILTRKALKHNSFTSVAVATRAGYLTATYDLDRVGIDLRIQAGGDMRPAIELQLKATVNLGSPTGGYFRFALKKRNYDLLIAESQTPRLLMVLDLPDDEDEWMTISEESLVLRRRAYWANLAGLEERTNLATVTVRIPCRNVFDVPSLQELMDQSRVGKLQ